MNVPHIANPLPESTPVRSYIYVCMPASIDRAFVLGLIKDGKRAMKIFVSGYFFSLSFLYLFFLFFFPSHLFPQFF